MLLLNIKGSIYGQDGCMTGKVSQEVLQFHKTNLEYFDIDIRTQRHSEPQSA